MDESNFTWRDGERTIHFRAGIVNESPDVLKGHGFDEYELLTTERAMGAAPVELAEDSTCFHHVGHGPVNEVAARLFDDVGDRDLVALGGGRVIDVAKAIAAVGGVRVAALPTTLSGAEMTAIHRLPEGREAKSLMRPQVVLADPPLMVGLPEERLRASAMNALAHAADCLYTPLANPVSEMAALRGAKLIAKALDRDPAKRKPEELALGAILSGYAIDSALFGLHHVVSQSLVRVMRLSHAETNAAVLPRVTELLISRAGPEMTALARAIGTKQADLPQRIEELAGGRRHLGEIGGDRALINDAVTTIMARPELKMTPDAPDESEIRGLIENAW